MANNNNEGVNNNSDSSKDSGLDKSFVGKFVSGLLNNTPLSKWFGKESSSKSVVRRRDDDEEDEDSSYVFQPPVKRAKLPSNAEHNNYSAHLFESPVTVHNASNNVNNVSSRVFGKFPEPVAGPSGIKSRKLFEIHNSTASTNTVSSSFENEDVVNGENDSDSEESTSGYSSAPKLVNKEKSTENTNTVNNEDTFEKTTPKFRSLFTSTKEPSHSRTLFGEKSPQMNTSLSSRRPTFNASTFGSPNFVDRTLSTKNILNSPFYNGHTIYGGASAYGRRLGRSADELNSSVRASVQIKPVNKKMTNDNTTLSKTARRILSTLEQYSTPISDAKKIPVTPKREGILSKYIGATPYSMRDREKKRPSHKELQIPSIPELLQMKQKEKLQNSTVSVRQIATTSKSTLNKEEYKLRTEDDNKQKYSNKMKSNLSSLRQKSQPDEPVAELKLPKVSLPITTLPKFDFVMMPPQSSNEANKNNTESVAKSRVSTENKGTSTTVSERKEVEKKSVVENGKTIFKFSEPLIISKDPKTVSAINCFKFSEPLCKKQCVDVGVNFKSAETSTGFSGFKMKNNGENVKSTSPLADVLRKKDDASSSAKNKSKAETATWECQTCLVKNDMDKVKCVACHELKSPPEEPESKKGFGDQFKLTSDKWECGSCMVRNSNADRKCVACGTVKPSSKSSVEDEAKPTWKCTNCLTSNKDDLDKCVSCGLSKVAKPFGNFGDKFKPSNDTWECSACMIRNKNEQDKCEACQTPKVQSKPVVQKTVRFQDTFKPPSDTWECPTCMIRNKNDVTKCAACETAKPGEKPAAPSTTARAASSTFTFGIPPPEWECKTCLVKNKNDSQKCVSCGSMKENKDQEKKGFGDVFKMKAGEWDCTSCLVRNKAASDVCTCCGVSKPGTASEKLSEIGKDEGKKPVISFNFGIDKSSPIAFKFGIPSSKGDAKDSSGGAVVTSAPAPMSTPASVPAPAPTSTPAPAPLPTFSFGDATKSSAASFTFGIGTTASTKSVTSTNETVTASSSVGSGNPLLKPNEKLPEKAMPAPVGFKFGLDNSKPITSSENSVINSKTEAAPVVFSSSFEPAKPTMPTPTFQFKPAGINGDVNKPKELPFSSKPPESGNLFASKPAESSVFSKPSENTNLFTSKPTESGGLFTSKPADSNNVFASKPAESGALFASKPAESAGLFANKPVESGSLFSNKPAESGNLFGNKPAESSNLFSTKPAESGGLFASKPAESGNLFSNKPTESGNLFSNKPAESNNPFGNKPAESGSLFSNKPTESGNLFSSKPAESSGLFTNKPPETNLFSNKPAEGSGGLFSNTTMTPAFKFNVKPTESATPTASTLSQPEVNQQPVFKFGADTSQSVIPMKKAFGESNDSSSVSNGFGTVPKIPAFGNPQPFGGATSENKPFTFGAGGSGNDSMPKNTGFSFGQPQPQPQPQPEKPAMTAPVFSFGSGSANVPGSGFNFSSPPSGGFNFGGAGKIESQPFGTPPPPQPTNVFGTGAAPGAAKNGSFNFGTNSNNNNQKAVFTFGASQTSQPSFPTQSQPGFNFGAPAPPTIPTGGFNFSGAPPSFNFTDGTQSTAPPQRKIKKALRRTHR